MLTIEDLKVMRPSDALEKAVEAFPYVGHSWITSYWLDGHTGVCSGALLAHAFGIGDDARDLDWDANDRMNEIARENIARENSCYFDYHCGSEHVRSYGRAIAYITQMASGRDWPGVIAYLRERGL